MISFPLKSPVVVLDFQSIYPSVMIAYNMCFSTCLGHIDDLWKNGAKRMGVNEDTRPHIAELFGPNFENLTKEEIMKKVIMTPNNVLFVRKSVREGIISRILEEFLMTRIMVKKAMKLVRNLMVCEMFLW